MLGKTRKVPTEQCNDFIQPQYTLLSEIPGQNLPLEISAKSFLRPLEDIFVLHNKIPAYSSPYRLQLRDNSMENSTLQFFANSESLFTQLPVGTAVRKENLDIGWCRLDVLVRSSRKRLQHFYPMANIYTYLKLHSKEMCNAVKDSSFKAQDLFAMKESLAIFSLHLVTWFLWSQLPENS